MSDGCPDEATIVEFVQGELHGEPADRLEAHLDGCEACSQVVAELVRIFDEPSSGSSSGGVGALSDERLPSEELAVTIGGGDEEAMPSPLGPMLAAGAEVGRYRVLECVGVGGMGVVYAAYDPELDRRVALKLLRGARDDPGAESRSGRLLREAQALAKLTHPNVITVHDVGTWEEQVFVAMEFVDGMSLKEWMGRGPHHWREIRDVFVAAARGLAAAHAVGLVHRDFKPDNVLIGRDGRVRVTDFGLARWGEPTRAKGDLLATDELNIAGSSRVSAEIVSAVRNPLMSLTETGTLIGTPAYMAPEQYAQRGADAKSDQFAFCVALYEVIHGERPFVGRTVAELASNVMDGKLIGASTGPVSVPRQVRQALRRGLSRRPGARFASMDELIEVLDWRPARRWGVRLSIGVPLMVLGGGLWAYAERTEAPASAFCADESGLSGLWGQARRETIEQAFLTTELGYAEQTAQRTIAALDDYVEGWERLRQRSCDPDPAASEGPGIAVLRRGCLERRRVALGVLLDTLEEPDSKMVGRAVGAVAGLPELDTCADATALTAELPPPVPPHLHAAVEEVRDGLARGEGLLLAGRYDEALAMARGLDARATALGHRPLEAETRFLLAQMLDFVGEAEASQEAFVEAELLGTASRHRRLVARSLIHQVYVLGVALPRMDEAERVARRAEAEVEGVGLGDDSRSALLLNMGSVAYRRADYEEAARLCRRALALRDRTRNPLRWADVAFNLASIEVMKGDLSSAIERLQGYLEVYEAELGSMHPEVASGYQNLGVAYFTAGQYVRAREVLQEAERVRRQTLGADHPEYASTLNMLGSVAIRQGRLDEGLELVRRGVDLQVAAESDPTDIAVNRTNLARVLVKVGRIDDAEREVRDALEVLREAMGDDHPMLGGSYLVLAEIAAARADLEEMREHMERGRAIRVAALGPDELETETMVVEQARMLADLGEPSEAIELLRQMIGREGEGDRRRALAYAREALAQILWEQPEGRAESRQLAESAQRGFTEVDMHEQAQEVRQWLADRGG